MELRNLGRSGIRVAPLAFGGNVFGWTVNEQSAFTLLDRFTEAGFNLIDTADVYSRWVPGHAGGESEMIVGLWANTACLSICLNYFYSSTVRLRIIHIPGADGNLLQETNIVSVQLLGGMGTPMMKFATLCVLGAALLMAGCVSQQKYEASQQRNAELEAQYKQLNETMGSEIAAHELHISRMQDAIKVSLNDDLLFPSGGSEMSADAKTSVAKVAAILAPHQKNKINVNGYTDSTPIGPELEKQGITTNLILSQKRADTVMQFMISQGVKPNLVSAQGFGDANPVATNDTPEGRAQNRRVELTIASPGS